jgi:hypothetical protein
MLDASRVDANPRSARDARPVIIQTGCAKQDGNKLGSAHLF